MAGSLLPAHNGVYRFITQFPMKPTEATVWGRFPKTSCLWAALINGMSASCLDADDGHRAAMGHPGGVIVPAAVALAERVGATGRQFLEAVIIGYEIGLRVGIFLNRDQKNTYYGSGTWAAIGAAATGAKLLNLGPAQCLSALSIAEVNAPLALIMGWIDLRKPPEVKEGMGWSAFTGVSSALLAQQGVQGVFSLAERTDGQMITRGLGTEFEMTKLYYKQHSACRWTHAAIDGILQIAKDRQLNDKEVKKIVVSTHRKAACLDNPIPSRSEEAQYSIPYTVATAFLHGQVGPMQMYRDAINDPRTLELSNKIEVICDDELESRFPEASLARVTIETINGEKITANPSEFTKGDYQNPFTGPELEEKFRRYAGCAISVDQVDAILQTTRKIEELSNIEELIQLLRNNESKPTCHQQKKA